LNIFCILFLLFFSPPISIFDVLDHLFLYSFQFSGAYCWGKTWTHGVP
jgi:hypothetical protein